MYRNRGKALWAVAAFAAVGLVAGCGGNTTPASSKPASSAKPTTTTPTTSVSATTTIITPPAAADPTTPGTVSSNETGSDAGPQLSDKDRKYLDALDKQGVHPSSPDIATSIAQYVCQSAGAGASDQDLHTYVDAMAGSDPAFSAEKMPVQQVGQIYITTAKANYCQ